jgi:hypothetical protein
MQVSIVESGRAGWTHSIVVLALVTAGAAATLRTLFELAILLGDLNATREVLQRYLVRDQILFGVFLLEYFVALFFAGKIARRLDPSTYAPVRWVGAGVLLSAVLAVCTWGLLYVEWPFRALLEVILH